MHSSVGDSRLGDTEPRRAQTLGTSCYLEVLVSSRSLARICPLAHWATGPDVQDKSEVCSEWAGGPGMGHTEKGCLGQAEKIRPLGCLRLQG